MSVRSTKYCQALEAVETNVTSLARPSAAITSALTVGSFVNLSMQALPRAATYARERIKQQSETYRKTDETLSLLRFFLIHAIHKTREKVRFTIDEISGIEELNNPSTAQKLIDLLADDPENMKDYTVELIHQLKDSVGLYKKTNIFTEDLLLQGDTRAIISMRLEAKKNEPEIKELFGENLKDYNAITLEAKIKQLREKTFHWSYAPPCRDGVEALNKAADYLSKTLVADLTHRALTSKAVRYATSAVAGGVTFSVLQTMCTREDDL